MSKELYFIPIIARALGAPELRQALREAFAEIERLGRLPGYEQGLQQYNRFMETVRQEATRDKVDVHDLVRALMVDLTSDTFTGDASDRQAAFDLIQSRPEWQEEFERLATEARAEEHRSALPDARVYKGDKPVGTVVLSGEARSGSMEGIDPGRYTISLDTGRVIWEGELTARDLVWRVAFPGRTLAMAADTGKRAAEPTREESLLEGEVVLRVFAGVEWGRIELQVRSPRAR